MHRYLLTKLQALTKFLAEVEENERTVKKVVVEVAVAGTLDYGGNFPHMTLIEVGLWAELAGTNSNYMQST